MISRRKLRLHNVAVPFLVLLAVVSAHLLPTPLVFFPALLALGVCFYAFNRMTEIILAARLEKCALDEQLIQSQKLAAIGELSSGIAHEINNPLAVISQEAEWMTHLLGQAPLDSMPETVEVKDSLAQIQKQVDRCRTITHKLLNFARKMDPVFQEVDLSTVVEDMIVLVEREAANRDVALKREFAPDLPKVCTDAPLLRQVILNLLTNAFQAVDRGGIIRVIGQQTGPNEVSIQVEDDGAGIPPENMNKIFNPFFTTKDPGQGTGLGLSMCHAIVDRLGGRITVESEPGQGTVFTVLLPIQAKERTPWTP